MERDHEISLFQPWTNADNMAFESFTKSSLKLFKYIFPALGWFALTVMILAYFVLDRPLTTYPLITWFNTLLLISFPLIARFDRQHMNTRIQHRHTSYILKEDGLYIDNAHITNIKTAVISEQFMFMRTSWPRLYVLKIDSQLTDNIIQYIQSRSFFPIQVVPYSFSMQQFAYTGKIRKRGNAHVSRNSH